MGRRSRYAQGPGRGMSKDRKPETRLVEAGRRREWTQGIVNPPVWRASTILFDSVAEMEAANPPKDGVLHYGRNGTPTSWALCEALTELEPGAAMTRLYPSGSAAVAGALLAVLQAGDELLMVDSAYGPTRALCEGVLKRFGVDHALLRSAGRRRHRRADRRADPGDLHGEPGHAQLRGPGRAGDLRGGEGARPRHPDRQYLGDAALLPGDRRRGRSLDPRLHQICRRPCRSDAGLGNASPRPMPRGWRRPAGCSARRRGRTTPGWRCEA